MKPGQRVIVALRKMIASGELKSGERIAEIPMAEALGVSRMPVRTALRALEQEGLVVKLGARGYAARSVSAGQIESAIEVRGVLEGLAARKATLHGLSEELVVSFEQCLAGGDDLFAKGALADEDLDRYHDYNQQFHSLLVTAGRNLEVEDALARHSYRPFASASAFALDWTNLDEEFHHLFAAHQQHRAVYDAIRRGDAEAAERIMQHHALAAVRHVRVFESLGADAHPSVAAWAIRSD